MSLQITQETFDGAVRENMEEFGLSAEDAIADAVKEFEKQVGSSFSPFSKRHDTVTPFCPSN